MSNKYLMYNASASQGYFEMKIAYFSTGAPDPTQGGSGITSFLICKTLLQKGHTVKAFFRNNEDFLSKHCNLSYLEELSQRGLQYEFVNENRSKGKFKLGRAFVLQQYQYAVCKKTVDDHRKELMQFDGCLTTDLGWVASVGPIDLPKVSILGDPIFKRLKYGPQPSCFSPRGLWHLIRRISLWNVPKIYRQLLKDFDGKRSVLGSFAPQEVEEYRKWGLEVRHFRAFSPRPAICKKYSKPQGKFIMLHIGSLHTSASQKMLKFWITQLFPKLADLPFIIEFRLVGKYNPAKIIKSKWPNIILKFLGHKDSLDQEFQLAHAYFSPMNYPVGVRTRVITALSYGLPTIADPSTALGLPELANEKDIIYGCCPDEIYEILNKIYHTPEILRGIGANARTAWEKYFDPNNNISEFLKVLNVNSL